MLSTEDLFAAASLDETLNIAAFAHDLQELGGEKRLELAAHFAEPLITGSSVSVTVALSGLPDALTGVNGRLLRAPDAYSGAIAARDAVDAGLAGVREIRRATVD
jgi:hypothetical protein